jgi:uncharacterized hydrophobic protein (TIGR00271 family)
VLHLRVISPTEQTEAVRKLLLDERGATHVATLPGAAIQPPGDIVEADIAREAADEVLERLRELGVDCTGGITLESVDIALSDAATAAEEAAPGDPNDAVIWEELIARTGEESRLTVTFQAFLTIALILAAIGVITDSPVTVVGAMVLGPEFGPLAAVAVGMVLRRLDLIKRGALALAVGFPLAMGATALAAVAMDVTGLLSVQQVVGVQQVDFIYQVGPFSLIIALLAGAAGMLALVSAKSASLVGVFISVTTVPAAAYAAVAAVEGEFGRAGESALQLLINLVGIVISAAVVLLLVRRMRAARPAGLRDRGRPLSSG